MYFIFNPFKQQKSYFQALKTSSEKLKCFGFFYRLFFVLFRDVDLLLPAVDGGACTFCFGIVLRTASLKLHIFRCVLAGCCGGVVLLSDWFYDYLGQGEYCCIESNIYDILVNAFVYYHFFFKGHQCVCALLLTLLR